MTETVGSDGFQAGQCGLIFGFRSISRCRSLAGDRSGFGAPVTINLKGVGDVAVYQAQPLVEAEVVPFTKAQGT